MRCRSADLKKRWQGKSTHTSIIFKTGTFIASQPLEAFGSAQSPTSIAEWVLAVYDFFASQ